MAQDSAEPFFGDDELSASGGDDSTHFSWEFAGEDRADYGPRRSPLPDDDASHFGRPALGGDAEHGRRSRRVDRSSQVVEAVSIRSRAATIQRMLDAALDQWWRDGSLLTQRQLRDGLELLVIGVDLPEPQHTLLLRSALVHGHGIVTALRFQNDPERVGLVMTEMLLDGLPPETLAPLLARPDTTAESEWADTLARELRLVLATGDPVQRQCARDACETIFGAGLGARLPNEPIVGPYAHGRRIRRILLMALAIAFVGFFAWQRWRWLPPSDMVAVPSGVYVLVAQDGNASYTVPSDGFFVDRFEVTNVEYRRCIEQGACGWPLSNDSLTRDDYLVIPAFADYPVVNVTAAGAEAYCSWRGKRLPTAIEWQIAAGGPANTFPTDYPWGVTFDAQRANSLPAGTDDTLVVGFFRPAGDSYFGLSDMAGNVAEWTATSSEDALTARSVKGGSFRSDREQVRVGAQEFVAADNGLPWLGFRCVRGQTTGQ